METLNSKHGSYLNRKCRSENGSALILVVVSLVILGTLGLGMLTVGYGARHKAIRLKNEAVSMLSAEAGYERAVFWMSQQQDMLSALQKGVAGTSGKVTFPDGDYCDYKIQLYTFVGSRPVYRIISEGHSGVFKRTVDVLVLQAMSGWDMGMCRVAGGSSSTYPVNFSDGEVIDMPLHINELNDAPDERDIYIIGSPTFLEPTAMGEPRETDGGYDKYGSVMNLFDGGIYFDQPDSKITNDASIQSKVDRFRDSTKAQFRFKPTATAAVTNPNAAVHIEFISDGGAGKIRITNNCTVRGFQQSSDYRTWDFRVKPDTKATEYKRYDIYGYHVRPENADITGERFTVDVTDTYVTQSIGGVESEPGGQIFVDGNVVLGSGDPNLAGQDVVNGKITIVATGNIWVADSTVVDGAHDAGGKPSKDNPNVLGLVSQGIIKVVDPGMSDYSYVDGKPKEPTGFEYVPIGRQDEGQWVYERVGWSWVKVYKPADEHERHLPDPMVLEAALTVGGGGWGAENVERNSYGGRKEEGGSQDKLIVRGTLTEAIRGVVGLVGGDGYYKCYYLDERFLEGILPGDIWLRGKYIPAPAGWHDYRPKI